MKCAIMQPTYFPWLGYFDLIDYVDIFVILDHVQLTKRTWQVRNKIKTSQGSLYLTIPIKKTKSRNDTLICDAIIDNSQNWKKKHLRSIELSYKKSKYFDIIFPLLKEFYNNNELLSDFTFNIIKKIASKLSINTKFLRSSKMNNINKGREKGLVAICENINIKKYVCPESSSNYIEKKTEAGGEFSKNNIEVFYRIYEHPKYYQMFDNFIPYIGIIDLLFNKGFDKSLDIIRNGRKMVLDHNSFRSKILKI